MTTMDRAPEPFMLALAVLDELRQPLLVVDECRVVLLRNRAATRWLADRGLCGVDEATLQAPDAGLESQLQELLAAIASGTRERGLLRFAACGEHPAATATVARVRANGPRMLALVSVLDAQAGDGDSFELAALYSLTPAEARVAGGLTRGWSPKRIASESGVSLSTVRSQVQSLFGKTGAHRQSDLVRLMLLASLR
jgi:DNA-binding CsgD family transcriptional regulator